MEKQRYHYFDFLRATAMLLGIPFHVAFAYAAIEYQWLVKDPQHSYIVDWGLYFLRIFRMPLFFVISGFFAHYMIKKNAPNFLLVRLKRLLIPLGVLFVLIICPLRALWFLGEMMSSSLDISFKTYISFVSQNFYIPTTSRFTIPASWGHLWFLLYLFLFSTASFWLRKLKFIKLNLLYLIALTFLSFFLMASSWVDLPFSLLPKPSLLFYYGLFYYYGWQLLNKTEGDTNTHLVSYLFLIMGFILAIARAYLEVDSKLSIGLLVLPPISEYFLYFLSSLSTWLIIVGLIGTMKKLITRENRIINFFVKASYSIYLIHLPIIVIFQLLLYRINLSWPLKLILISLATLVLSSFIYKYLIEDKWPERFLKGQY